MSPVEPSSIGCQASANGTAGSLCFGTTSLAKVQGISLEKHLRGAVRGSSELPVFVSSYLGESFPQIMQAGTVIQVALNEQGIGKAGSIVQPRDRAI
jgi:hypothetical protein